MFEKMYESMDLLQHGLSASWTRNAVIRNNLANVETPNFKASDVEFESLMERALTGDAGGFECVKTHAGHRDIGTGAKEAYVDAYSITPQVYQREDTAMRMDGNNVDIESENVKLVQNTTYYNTLMEKLNSEIRRLRMAITEGR